jgi:hypothetical protein
VAPTAAKKQRKVEEEAQEVANRIASLNADAASRRLTNFNQSHSDTEIIGMMVRKRKGKQVVVTNV